MTIDKEKLKALAEAMLRDEQGAELSGEEVRGFPEAVRSYEAMTAPSAVLALLAEIEQLAFEPAKHSRRLIDQLKAENEDYKSGQERYEQIIDDLKAENEALRKQIADLWPLKNVPPQDFRASNKCLACGDYHHGLGNLPCPRCTPVAQSAMAKEVPHG
ncbi:hypothetical protein LU683_30085 [Pseudomonas asiatica]|uniref:hypothetical protein n=1 Tax=Pseudomonas TaxID=286 RepID=UPI001E57B03E|nr:MULTISPECIES: hypothetical protein [Pseudomonas]MCE0757135.1 hypothetical protein [Pseudomonas asiatica]MCE0955099.1 hypothetical protein [Pseudomonas asiatica]MCE1033010.1 hypothetical protein [Pseudomonas asiatica]MCE1067532.1 hypothetical protein [Pseudomonas asiatica]MCE1102220.1 hypothetical protein [Pseudomonas asiatica]